MVLLCNLVPTDAPPFEEISLSAIEVLAVLFWSSKMFDVCLYTGIAAGTDDPNIQDAICEVNIIGVNLQLSGPWKTTLVLTSELKVYFRGEENNPQLPKLKMF